MAKEDVKRKCYQNCKGQISLKSLEVIFQGRECHRLPSGSPALSQPGYPTGIIQRNRLNFTSTKQTTSIQVGQKSPMHSPPPSTFHRGRNQNLNRRPFLLSKAPHASQLPHTSSRRRENRGVTASILIGVPFRADAIKVTGTADGGRKLSASFPERSKRHRSPESEEAEARRFRLRRCERGRSVSR